MHLRYNVAGRPNSVLNLLFVSYPHVEGPLLRIHDIFSRPDWWSTYLLSPPGYPTDTFSKESALKKIRMLDVHAWDSFSRV